MAATIRATPSWWDLVVVLVEPGPKENVAHARLSPGWRLSETGVKRARSRQRRGPGAGAGAGAGAGLGVGVGAGEEGALGDEGAALLPPPRLMASCTARSAPGAPWAPERPSSAMRAVSRLMRSLLEGWVERRVKTGPVSPYLALSFSKKLVRPRGSYPVVDEYLAPYRSASSSMSRP